MTADLGADVRVLGDVSRARYDTERDELAPSGQATFHIDLDVALLGRFGRQRRPVALVGDPVRGLGMLDHVLAHRALFARHLVPARRLRRLLAEEFAASRAGAARCSRSTVRPSGRSAAAWSACPTSGCSARTARSAAPTLT